jgi:hypothetical protein
MPISNSIDHLFEVNPGESASSIHILDESVRASEGKAYKVLCTVDASFIAVALLNIRETKFVGLDTFHFGKSLTSEQLSAKIASLKNESNILKNVSFDKVSVQLSHSNYTFAPSALFHKEEAEKYFYLNHLKKLNQRIENETIRNFDIVNIFSVDEQVRSSLQNAFGDVAIHHHITSLLYAIRLQSGKENVRLVHLNFRAAWVDVIVTEEKKVILANSFNYKSAEDALYFILTVYEQLGMNPKAVEAVVMGETEKESAIVQLMKRYISNVNFTKRMQAANYSYGFDKLPSHFYYSVFGQTLCE